MQGPSLCPNRSRVAWHAHIGPPAGACMRRKGGRCSGGGTASMQARARGLSPLLQLSPPVRSTVGTTQGASVPIPRAGDSFIWLVKTASRHTHANLPVQGVPWRLPRNSKGPNAAMLLPLHSMMVVGWVAVPLPDTHRTLISLGAVRWSDGWGSLALKWEVSGLLFCCLLLLSLNAGGVCALCLHLHCLFQTNLCLTASTVFSFLLFWEGPP